jgi:hypothetical protein
MTKQGKERQGGGARRKKERKANAEDIKWVIDRIGVIDLSTGEEEKKKKIKKVDFKVDYASIFSKTTLLKKRRRHSF